MVQSVRESIINPIFAGRVGLESRLKTLDGWHPCGPLPDPRQESARAVDHTFLTVGRERYDRVGSAVAVEPRDPFLDRRVVAFCLSLPGDQKLKGGWPKVILRRAMVGRLPDEVCWRQGKQHLGWAFTTALMQKLKVDMEPDWVRIQSYAKVDRLRQAYAAFVSNGDLTQAELLYDAVHLSVWLDHNSRRPKELLANKEIYET